MSLSAAVVTQHHLHHLLSCKPACDASSSKGVQSKKVKPVPKRYLFSLFIRVCVCPLGQERFGNMTRVYYREAMGAFIVFDVTRPASFEAITKWKEDLDSKLTLANGKHVATVLLANKCDQGRDVLTNNGIKMDQFCQENGFVGWYETSAKVRKEGHTRKSKVR